LLYCNKKKKQYTKSRTKKIVNHHPILIFMLPREFFWLSENKYSYRNSKTTRAFCVCTLSSGDHLPKARKRTYAESSGCFWISIKILIFTLPKIFPWEHKDQDKMVVFINKLPCMAINLVKVVNTIRYWVLFLFIPPPKFPSAFPYFTDA